MTASVEPVSLTENFYISNKKKQTVRIQVKLMSAGIYLRRETELSDHINEQLIRIEDIYGSRYGGPMKKRSRGASLTSCRSPADGEDAPSGNATAAGNVGKDSSAYLHIYAYVKTEQPFRRNRTLRILRFRSSDSYDENLKIAEQWQEGIKANKRHRNRVSGYGERPLLILLNPKSGSGKGREMFQKQVAPLLKEAEIPYEVHVTTHGNNARELVRKRTDLLQRYCAIVVASGDGLFYEVLNGMLERPDWRLLSQELPLGILPCGSGNGLAKTIAHLYNEPYEPKPVLYAALTCLSGNYAPMDVVRVQVGRGERSSVCYSFLSIGWGLIADIDIESERLRSIGASRFTLWSIHRVVQLRTYKGTVHYLPWRENESSASATQQAVAPLTEELFKDTLSLNSVDEFADIASYKNADSWRSAYSKRTAYYSADGGQSISSQRTIGSPISRRLMQANAHWEANAPGSTLPPLETPLPPDSGWVSISGDFIMVHTSCSTHIAADCHFSPQSRLNDGIIYLVIIRSGIPRSQLVQFLLSMNTGTHLPQQPNEHIQLVAARAFRIEPAPNEEGIMTVDGERIEYGPVQCEVLPGLIKILVPNDKPSKEV